MMGLKLDAAQQKRLDDFTLKVEKLVEDGLSWGKLKPDFVKLYAEQFSEAELDDMIRFYQTASGKAMVEKQPALMTASGAITQKRMLEIVPQMQQLMKDFAAELAAAPKQP